MDIYWNEQTFNWINTISELKSLYNLDILISWSVRDGERRRSMAFYLDSPKYQPMYKLFRSREEALQEITSLLQKYSSKSSEISRVASEVYDIEYKLYRNNPLPGKRSEYEEVIYKNSAEGIDYEGFITASVGHRTPSFKKYVATNGYFQNLQEVVSSTPKRKLANYIMWSFIRQMNITNDQDTNRRKFCLTLTKQYFPQVLGEMYNNQVQFTLPRIEADLLFMRNHLPSALKMDGLDWKDQESNTIIQQKLSNTNINYIKYNSNDVKESMQPMNRTSIQANFFLQNIFSLMSLQASNAKNKIFSDFNRKETDNSVESFSVFPSYQPDQNTVRIPKGMFNYPLYGQDFPNAIKFSQIGVLITRELIKSLTEGNDRSSFRWVDRVLDKYYDRVKCFVQQYKNFKFGAGNLPEIEDQNENIADNGAVRVAFKAYLNWLTDRTISKETLNDETLSNVDFTNTQLFFISYAQTYCSSLLENEEFGMPDNKKDIKDFIPEKIRVNAALSNFDEFSIEFNCPTGSVMNAPDKCIFY